MSRENKVLKDLSERELLDRLENAMEGAELGTWDWDLRDNSVHFDRRWAEMLGLNQSEIDMELSTWESRVHPDDLAKCYEDIKAYLNGDTKIYENIHRMKHTNGEWVYILDRGRISGWDADGKPVRFTGTHFEVTATEKAKREALSAHETLREMIHTMPTSVAMFDTEVRYLAASTRWLDDHNLSWDSIEGKCHYDVSPQLSDYWKQIHLECLNGQVQSRDRDLIEKDNGEHSWLRWSAKPWKASDGSIGGILVVMEDITEIVESEIQIVNSSKLSALGEMAGAIAHEINNPLAIMKVLCIDLTHHLKDSASLSKAGESISKLDCTIDRISEIVSSMKRLMHRGEGRDGQEPAKNEECSLKLVLDDIVSVNRQRFKNHSVDLIVEHCFESDDTVAISYSDLSQIIVNLINNSFSQVADTEQAWVKVLTEVNKGNGLKVSVIDSGKGVPANIQSRIFEPFFTTKAVGQGTGLGLSLSKSLAQSSEADLNLDKESPNTKFDLSLKRVS